MKRSVPLLLLVALWSGPAFAQTDLMGSWRPHDPVMTGGSEGGN